MAYINKKYIKIKGIEIIYLYLYYINKIYLIIEIYENYFINKKITIQ